MRLLKIVGWVVACLAVLLAGVAGTVAVGGDPLIARLAQSRGSAALGREVQLGRLEVTWGSPIRLVAEDVRIANAPWGSGPDLFTSRRLEAELDLKALLRLDLGILRLELTEPALLLETSAADGRGNWEGGRSAGGTVPDLRRLIVRQGRLRFRNGETAAQTDVALADLVADASDRLRPTEIAASGVFEEQPFAVTAAMAPLSELRRKSWPSPVRFDGQLGANSVAFEGTSAEPLTLQDLDVRVDMAGEDLQQVLATLGVPIPRVPLYRLSGHLRRNGAEWTIEELSGQIGQSHLDGRILVDAGPRVPYIRAELTARYLELADLKGFYGGEPGAAPAAGPPKASGRAADGARRLIPDFRISREPLLGFNADFSLDAPRVKPSGGVPFERVSFGVSLHDGTLRIREARLAVAEGVVLANIEYRSTEKPPPLRADIEMRRVDLRRLFAGMDVSAPLKQTAGLAGGFARLRSAGETQREFLAGLGGEVGLFLQDGRLGGKPAEIFDLRIAEALGLAAKNNLPLPIRCFVARFRVDGGVATADTLLLDTPSTVVAGLGNVNIGDETLFLDLKPYPRKGDNALGDVRVPIAVRGTFAKPDFAADKTGLAERLGAALGLVPTTIPATMLPLLEAGLGRQNGCGAAFGARPAGEGSSAPPQRPAR